MRPGILRELVRGQGLLRSAGRVVSSVGYRSLADRQGVVSIVLVGLVRVGSTRSRDQAVVVAVCTERTGAGVRGLMDVDRARSRCKWIPNSTEQLSCKTRAGPPFEPARLGPKDAAARVSLACRSRLEPVGPSRRPNRRHGATPARHCEIQHPIQNTIWTIRPHTQQEPGHMGRAA